MALYYNESGLIKGGISETDRYVIGVKVGKLIKRDNDYLLVAKVEYFSNLQKFGERDFKISDGSIISLPLHDSSWKTKKWDKEKGGYTDEEIEHTPSIQELALIAYINSAFEGKWFTGVIELVASKITKLIVANDDMTNATLVFDLLETSETLSDADLSSQTAKKENSRRFKTPKEVYEERLEIFKLCLQGVVPDECNSLVEITEFFYTQKDHDKDFVTLLLGLAKTILP